MKRILLCLLSLAAPLAAKNLFDNPSMDTAGGWKGQRKIEKEKEGDKENRFLSITADKKDRVMFSQEVNTRGMTSVVVTFRYRIKDYVGAGLYVYADRNDYEGSSSSRYTPVVSDGKWHTFTTTFKNIGGSNKVDFEFYLERGVGEIHVDDIVAEPK